MLGDVTHLQEILMSLCKQAANPDILPESSEAVIDDISACNRMDNLLWDCKVYEFTWFLHDNFLWDCKVYEFTWFLHDNLLWDCKVYEFTWFLHFNFESSRDIYYFLRSRYIIV